MVVQVTGLRIAVLTLTRDRLAYSQTCFASLRENAGVPFDHYILDQGSTDGTQDWLRDEYDCTGYYLADENLGVSRGINKLIDIALETASYDVVVKFDNDCEVLTPDTLREVCTVADEWELLLSPHIHGLRTTPQPYAKADTEGHIVSITPVIGGIFLAAPAHIFDDGYRHDENNPVWGGDDTGLCAWWQAKGKHVGYLDGFHANHYLTTDGQQKASPEYWARKEREYHAA